MIPDSPAIGILIKEKQMNELVYLNDLIHDRNNILRYRTKYDFYKQNFTDSHKNNIAYNIHDMFIPCIYNEMVCGEADFEIYYTTLTAYVTNSIQVKI